MITGYGVLVMKAQYFIRSYSNNPHISNKAVALTFDDGPNEHTVEILKILERYHAKGTFFCIGKQIKEHPEIFKQIIEKGHLVGNHTYGHSKYIDLYGVNRFVNEIRKTDQIIKEFSGKSTLLFRPPYGITNPTVAKALKITKHKVIGWNRRSFDTTIPSESVIFKKITSNLKNGDVILLHDTKKITAAVLEQLLLFLQQNNVTTVMIDELFSIQAYE
ncbi:polysaccharide deacetylase family protein [Aquimarina addita]|uniref:Polysaccharide deacetylase family protein n=2 Tax=Aquimarina addita TaxID=870485 RepID=A0ABP6UIY2_9FLAO